MADRYLKWQREVLAELRAIRRLLEADTGAEPEPACPQCSSTNLEDTSTAGDKRTTCLDCCKSFAPEEAVNG